MSGTHQRSVSALDGQYSQIVHLRAAASKGSQVVETGGYKFGGLPPALLLHEAIDTIHPVFLARSIGLGKAIAVDEECVAGFQFEAADWELTLHKHP